jgi:ubiquinone/menaquinone biosynthesis C-methylase UbiE
MAQLSARLREIVEALPLKPGMRVLEIGCGPGAMARELAGLVGRKGAVLGIDRSAKAIALADDGENPPNLRFRTSKVEAFLLEDGEARFDLAVAIRVGALDGRHPEIEKPALEAIAKALKPGARLYVDGGDPIREILLPR